MNTQNTSSPSIRVYRLAVLTMFFINGTLFASWISRIPQVQDDLSLSEGQLGIVLLGLAVGVLTALSLTSGLIARYSSRQVTLYGATGMCFMLPILGLLPNAVILWGGLFLFGMMMSSMDVAMNAQAVVVEQLAKRPLMSAFHASFSIGGFAGAAIGAGFATLAFSPLMHFMIIAAVFVVIVFVTARYLPKADDHKTAKMNQTITYFSYPRVSSGLWVRWHLRRRLVKGQCRLEWCLFEYDYRG
jgi:predicted MFS family arabinose efflux permease